MVHHMQINKCNIARKQIKEKNHVSISVDTEKAFDKIQYPFTIKALKKFGIEGMYLNIMLIKIKKPIFYQPIINTIPNGEKLKPFHLKSGMRQGCSCSPLVFNVLLGFVGQ
jgi:hypothetical protein